MKGMCIPLQYIGNIVGFLHGADISGLRYLNIRQESIWHPVLATLSDTTSFLAYGIPAGISILAALFRRRGIFQRGLWSLATVLGADYLALLVKNLVRRPRPYQVYRDIILSTDGGNSSFPSGHTVQAFAMAIGITVLYRQKAAAALLLCWAAAVGLSRVCMGAHYPSDVLAAVLLALLVAYAVRWLHNLLCRS